MIQVGDLVKSKSSGKIGIITKLDIFLIWVKKIFGPEDVIVELRSNLKGE